MLVYGTVGYILIEGWDLLDAVYMTVITMTTVGYAEVHPLGASGRIFTISVIVLGVIGFFYTFGVLVELLSSGEWQRFRRARRLERQLEGLRDHVIVCGYGRTGRQVVRELQRAKASFIVVEWNPEGLKNVDADKVPHLVGDASNEDVLEQARVRQARALVSAVDSDERNVYIVLTARSLNPELSIVSRSSYPETNAKLERAGADRVVSPYTLSGRRMAALALQPAVVDTFDVLSGQPSDSNLRVEELVVGQSAPGGLTAGTLRRSGAVLLALRSTDGTLRVNPADAEELRVNDIVVAMGAPAQLDTLASALRPVSAAR